MDDINSLHSLWIKQHHYISDISQYGIHDKWVASLTGDCEDYALWVQIELRKHYILADLWLVKTEKDELHVVAVVSDDIILDSRHLTVMTRDSLGYKWLAPVEYYNKINRDYFMK